MLKKINSLFKQLTVHIMYFCVGGIACFFSFILVVNFLNPALSKEPTDQKENLTFRHIIKGTFKQIADIFINTFKKDQTQSPPKKELTKPLQEASPMKSDKNLPQAPSNFEGDTYGETIPQDNTQASKKNDMTSEVLMEVQSYMAPFIYESTKAKDPFEDPTTKKSESVIILPKTPPEKYDLKEIKLRGLTWNTTKPKFFTGTKTFIEPKALFELPNNEGFYTLRRGDKIGKKGVIFAIRESEVVVVERIYIGSGKNRKEKRTIKIKKMNRLSQSVDI